MPGAPNSNPGRQGVARLLLAAGQRRRRDGRLRSDARRRAPRPARSRRRLAARARRPEAAVGRDLRRARGSSTSLPDASGLAATVASLAQRARRGVAGRAEGLGNRRTTRQPPAQPPTLASPPPRRFPIRSRQRACCSAVPPSSKDRSARLPPDIRTSIGDQASVLGPRQGVLARWLQDSARVRAPAAEPQRGALARRSRRQRARRLVGGADARGALRRHASTPHPRTPGSGCRFPPHSATRRSRASSSSATMPAAR